MIIFGSDFHNRTLCSEFELSLSVDTPPNAVNLTHVVLRNSLYVIALAYQLLKRPQPIYKLNKY